MIFVINGLKYDTEKMDKVANVEKWYRCNDAIFNMLFPDKTVGRIYDCELWRSQKGNWLITHETDYKMIAEAIGEKEAKKLLMKYALEVYEYMFGEIEEA